MVSTEELQKEVEEHIKLITVDAKAISEARERSVKFLALQSLLANFLRELDTDKAKVETLQDVRYAQAWNSSDGKNVTDKKVFSLANTEYTEAREQLAKLNALREWVKTNMKIFENAHLTFRQFSRD